MNDKQTRSRSFDDGNQRVPGDLETPVERVVVAGAGMAGLTVANALVHAGLECLVLEARDRIGGPCTPSTSASSVASGMR